MAACIIYLGPKRVARAQVNGIRCIEYGYSNYQLQGTAYPRRMAAPFYAAQAGAFRTLRVLHPSLN